MCWAAGWAARADWRAWARGRVGWAVLRWQLPWLAKVIVTWCHRVVQVGSRHKNMLTVLRSSCGCRCSTLDAAAAWCSTQARGCCIHVSNLIFLRTSPL